VVGTSNSVPEIAMDWCSLHQNLHDWVFHDWVFHPVTNHTHPFPQIKSIRTAPIYQNQWLPQGGKLVVRPLCLPKLPTLYVDVCSGINPDWFPSAHEWWITPIAKVILSRWNWTLAVHFLEKIAPRKRWPEKWRSSSICWILEFPIDLRFQRYGFETKCLLPWLRSTWDGQSHCLHLQGQAHYFFGTWESLGKILIWKPLFFGTIVLWRKPKLVETCIFVASNAELSCRFTFRFWTSNCLMFGFQTFDRDSPRPPKRYRKVGHLEILGKSSNYHLGISWK
jgi:hypothetical protein